MPTAPHKQPHQTQWEKVKLGDIGEVITGKTPSTDKLEYWDSKDYMFITPPDLKCGMSIYQANRYISAKGLQSIRANSISGFSILVGCIGSDLGNVTCVDSVCATNQQINALTSIKAKYSPHYVYYYLTLLKKYFRQIAAITTAPIVSKSMFENIKIPLPSLPTQENIAQILSTLDKKIELNTRINTELESMAKLLYTRYFVEYNFPDSSGKPYKASGGAMVYNPTLKREIPQDWEVASLNDICHLYQPKTIAEKDLIQNGKYFVYGANGIIGRYDKYNHEESEIVITCRGASCGNILRTIPQVWITGNAMVTSPKNKKIHKQFIKNTLEVIGIKNTITGSAQPQITRENLKGLYVAVPNDELLEKYFSTINPTYEIFLKNQQESQRLAEWRDYLLPLLMGDQAEVV